MAVTKRLRFEVLRRDDFACRYCGARAPDVELTVDHVTPKALGGTDTADNLVAACRPCNSGKSSASPDEHHVAQVADDALRWAAAIKQAAYVMALDDDLESATLQAFDGQWNDWNWGDDPANKIPRPTSWPHSVRTMLAAGLTPELLAQAIRVAMESRVPVEKTWAYFCGVAWRKVDRLQETARQLLDERES